MSSSRPCDDCRLRDRHCPHSSNQSKPECEYSAGISILAEMFATVRTTKCSKSGSDLQSSGGNKPCPTSVASRFMKKIRSHSDMKLHCDCPRSSDGSTAELSNSLRLLRISSYDTGITLVATESNASLEKLPDLSSVSSNSTDSSDDDSVEGSRPSASSSRVSFSNRESTEQLKQRLGHRDSEKVGSRSLKESCCARVEAWKRKRREDYEVCWRKYEEKCKKCDAAIDSIRCLSEAAVLTVTSTFSRAARKVMPTVPFDSSTLSFSDKPSGGLSEKTSIPTKSFSEEISEKTVSSSFPSAGQVKPEISLSTDYSSLASKPNRATSSRFNATFVSSPSLPTPQSAPPSSLSPDDEVSPSITDENDYEFLEFLSTFALDQKVPQPEILDLDLLSDLLDKPNVPLVDEVPDYAKLASGTVVPSAAPAAEETWTQPSHLHLANSKEPLVASEPEVTTRLVATYRYTTNFAQQILLYNGFTGVLDSLEALEAFNNLMQSGAMDGVSSTSASSKPGPIHIPSVGTATVASYAMHERPPSPPLDPLLVNDDDLYNFDPIPSNTDVSLPSTELHADTVKRLQGLDGITSVFPGLNSSWKAVGEQDSTMAITSRQITGITHIPLGPNDPMSISRLTNPVGISTADSNSSVESTPTSLGFTSNSVYSTNLSSSVNSLLIGAAFNGGYGKDAEPRRRNSSVSTRSRSVEDDQEDDSASSNCDHAPTNSSITSSRVTLPSIHYLTGIPPPPSPNYNTHPILQQPSAGGPQRSRPRKQQCPDCGAWFSNLVAHRSTHLTYEARPHTCTVCRRGFSRPNDLLRHQKSHQGNAAFNCPFYNADHRCHSSGGFSRCDTYKNHLKAMHFEYPSGTKKKERLGTGGKCKGCNEHFETADDWISGHVESGKCEYLD